MLVTCLFLFFLFSGHDCNNSPIVKTPLGKVSGYYKESHNGRTFSAFEGIPYAKPPLEDKRFEEPDPIEPWLGIWNATLPKKCAQTEIMREPNVISGTEDCLHINVYVPRKIPNPIESLDVIVHIHGGAYSYLSSTSYAHPEFLMDREIIFVSFNYRLGIFGFLSTEDDVLPGNNGLKDQVLALKWVQTNIASFGGNPNSVTLTGLSAGASSVHLHYFSELSRGLFHRGFSQSGVGLTPWSIQKEPLNKAKKLGHSVGCPTNDTRSLIDCLKQRPYKQILKKIRLFFGYRFLPIVPFGPVVEKGGSQRFLKEDPYLLLKKGQVLDVPWIASATKHEGLFPVKFLMDDIDNIDQNWNDLAPILLDFNYTLPQSEWEKVSQTIKRYYFKDEGLTQENAMELIRMVSERLFLNDAETAVRMQSKVTDSPVHFYLFDYLGDHNQEKVVGHGDDMKYFFSLESKSVVLTPDEIKMKDLLLDMLVSFARTGNPTVGNVDWEPTEYDELTYLTISGTEDEDIELRTMDEFSSRSFWKSLNFLEGENLISVVKDEL